MKRVTVSINLEEYPPEFKDVYECFVISKLKNAGANFKGSTVFKEIERGKLEVNVDKKTNVATYTWVDSYL